MVLLEKSPFEKNVIFWIVTVRVEFDIIPAELSFSDLLAAFAFSVRYTIYPSLLFDSSLFLNNLSFKDSSASKYASQKFSSFFFLFSELLFALSISSAPKSLSNVPPSSYYCYREVRYLGVKGIQKLLVLKWFVGG